MLGRHRGGKFYFPEILGPGGAFLDFDGDGDLDFYLTQGALLGAGETLADALAPPGDGKLPTDRLLRNDLVVKPDGRVVPHFVDVTEASGIHGPHFGMGVAVADLTGNGLPDLYVANLGPNQLWRNRGDGTFEDWSSRTGVSRVAAHGLGVVAADLTGDRRTDLYVANDGVPNYFWINQGAGALQEGALLAGVAVNRHGRPEAGMGVDAGSAVT